MSARRGSSFANKRSKTRRSSISQKKRISKIRKSLIVFAATSTLLISGFLMLKSSKKLWNGKDKVSIVVSKGSGDVQIVTFDPQSREIISVVLPKDTEVEVSRGLGKWKLGSVWNLSQNEGLEGKLLKETIIRDFKFPVHAWAEGPALNLQSKRLDFLLKALVIPYKSDLSFSDKLGIVLFSAKIDSVDRKEVNLLETNYLRSATLTDGQRGFLVTGLSSPKISSIFADDEISQKGYRLAIKDETGRDGIAKDVGEVLEILGAKVTSVLESEEKPTDCIVSAKNWGDAKKVAMIFSCKIDKNKLRGNFDLQITIGEGFAKRF